MSTSRLAAVSLLALVVALAGCTTVKLQVTNMTDQAMPAHIMGKGVNQTMQLAPYDNKFTELTFYNSDLPSQVTVRVGSLEQSFMVAEDGPEIFRVDVTVDGAIRMRGEDPMTEEHKVDVTEPMGEPEMLVE